MNSAFLPILLAATFIQFHSTDGIVMHPRMRRNISSAILASIYKYTDHHPDKANSHGKGGEKLRWYGADARHVLRQLQQEMQPQAEESDKSVLDIIKGMFTRKETMESRKLNNCFFTPMNCRVAPKSAVGTGGRTAILITDEQKEKLMATHGHRRKSKSRL